MRKTSFLAQVALYQDRPNDCWRWLGYINKRNGYGYTSRPGVAKGEPGRTATAPRFAYETMVGPISEGMQLDHTCRHRWCFNPRHLEPVTVKENQRRGLNGVLLTHCPQGHEYSAENTAYYSGHRCCKQCNRDKGNANYKRFRQSNPPKGGRYKTHCCHGHQLSGDNVYWHGEHRICITCKRDGQRARRAKIRAAAA